MKLRPFLALAPLVLAACGEEAPQGEAQGASGEVLQGSISDAMLPVDSVRSEPPLADPEAAEEVREAIAADRPATADSGQEADADEDPAAETPVAEDAAAAAED